MQKSTFKILKMDCPSEEQMIRMKLAEHGGIRSMDFDIAGRTLHVYHEGKVEEILSKLEQLQFDTSLVATTFAEHSTEGTNKSERGLLWAVLGINALFFVLEMAYGWISGSMGLIADSLDMLADTLVYSLALFAVGGTVLKKQKVAKLAGYFQLSLAIIGLVEVLRRFLGIEEIPHFETMIVVSVFALIANGSCLYLLQRSKSKEAHMKASMIFTSNDVIVNVGVILAGVLVYFTKSKFPDLIIGTIVFYIVARGAFKILSLARR